MRRGWTHAVYYTSVDRNALTPSLPFAVQLVPARCAAVLTSTTMLLITVNQFKARLDKFLMHQDVKYDSTADLAGIGHWCGHWGVYMHLRPSKIPTVMARRAIRLQYSRVSCCVCEPQLARWWHITSFPVVVVAWLAFGRAVYRPTQTLSDR